MAIRIIIADDHTLFRAGLRSLLEKETDIEVVAETGDGFDTIRAVSENPVDVLLLDLTMPGISGARVAETVLQEKPHLAVVVLTMHEDEFYIRELFKIGAKAFFLKKSSGKELVRVIRSCFRGERYLDPALAGKLVASLYDAAPQGGRGLGLLTPREKEVCRLLAYGYTSAEIAVKLSISDRTVETHRTNINAKLELSSRAELVQFAIDHGLLKTE